MKTRVSLLIAAILAALGISIAESPAMASVQHGCADSTFCAYQAKNEGQEIWHTSLYNIHLHTDGGVASCLDIPPAKWSNGTNVADNTGSAVLNDNTDIAWSAYDVYVYNWTDCNPGGGYYIFHGSGVVTLSDLSVDFYAGAPTVSLYHTITSVRTVLG